MKRSVDLCESKDSAISPSLLASIKVGKVPRRFSLGMDEYVGPEHYLDDSEDEEPGTNQPKSKKRKLSLSLKKDKENLPEEANRFDKAFEVEDEDYEKMAIAFVPKNTSKNTTWAVVNFNSWCKARNKRYKKPCPPNLLTQTPYDPKELSFWISRFLVETRRKNGDKYPPTSLYQILCGINRYIKSLDPKAPTKSSQH